MMENKSFVDKLGVENLAFTPLYQQVEKHVTQLLVEQRWKPGDMLPSEFQLAEEFGVSQGTVRKALNCLSDKNILERRQGVGTFVTEHKGQPALYRFFPLVADGQEPQLPESQLLDISRARADKSIADKLELEAESQTWIIKRRRYIDARPCLLEVIHLPYQLFSELEHEQEIPHTLYHYYQVRFNQTVHKTTDKIKACLATQLQAEQLEIKIGDPLLYFTRQTRNLAGVAIEFRQTYCRSDHYHYLVNFE